MEMATHHHQPLLPTTKCSQNACNGCILTYTSKLFSSFAARVRPFFFESVWCIDDFFLPLLRQYQQQEPEAEPETKEEEKKPLTNEELRRMKAETFEPENLGKSIF